jgi:hypothetical protein
MPGRDAMNARRRWYFTKKRAGCQGAARAGG